MMQNGLFCQRKVGFRKRREFLRCVSWSKNYDYRLLSYETVNPHAENHTQAQENRIPWQRECDYYDYYFCFITQSVRYVWTRYDLSPTFTYHDVCVCATFLNVTKTYRMTGDVSHMWELRCFIIAGEWGLDFKARIWRSKVVRQDDDDDNGNGMEFEQWICLPPLKTKSEMASCLVRQIIACLCTMDCYVIVGHGWFCAGMIAIFFQIS